jgi:DNA-binding FadR family transcriptional regulator
MFEYLNEVRRAVSWNKVVRSNDGPTSDHDSFAEHTRIFAAIEELNANEAQAAMRMHLISVSKRLFGDD